MSLRLVTLLFVILVVGVALGAMGIFFVQSIHLFAHPAPVIHSSIHW